ncbi:MAG TPA: 4-alpha-glucanotransferase [Longimicrobiales bacterium]|nr:4-alpha-glucanotransferase [Longimicrobiales bacterium]
MTRPHALRALARHYGVQTQYRDAAGTPRHATPEGLVAVLRGLGAPLDGPDDAERALGEYVAGLERRPAPPVAVAWDGGPLRLRLRGAGLAVGDALHGRLRPERGEERQLQGRVEAMGSSRATVVFSERLPLGYHRLELALRDAPADLMVISAPTRAWRSPRTHGGWGVFLPLYALQTERSWGLGDYSDLGDLAQWVGEEGGSAVGTLPLLAAFLDEPFEPSPYAPVSRLFWNELFLEVLTAPGAADAPGLHRRLQEPGFLDALRELREAPLVDYRRTAAFKRRALEPVAERVLGASERPAGLRLFLEERPETLAYARFRAATERHGSWHGWPRRMREGWLEDTDVDRRAMDYHLYVQWAAHEQLTRTSERAARVGSALYLDLPLGVHPDGFDLWRERELFVEGASVGAPPDALFSGGQDWGFPPLHPQRMREGGYRYLRACVANHMRYSGFLRLDHVMALHRLYWVPPGCSARDGVYVRYPAEELYALLSLESHRHHVELIGEDLGTVPARVRRAMERHGVRRMYVVQYEASGEPDQPLRPIPEGAVASVNTHDMPSFAGFWRDHDIGERTEQGLLDERGAAEEREGRRRLRQSVAHYVAPGEADEQGVLAGLLRRLAQSPAGLVLLSMEDLWLEPEPQNRPGTWRERPNWRRKAALSLERMRHEPAVRRAMEQMRAIRGRERQDGG